MIFIIKSRDENCIPEVISIQGYDNCWMINVANA